MSNLSAYSPVGKENAPFLTPNRSSSESLIEVEEAKEGKTRKRLLPFLLVAIISFLLGCASLFVASLIVEGPNASQDGTEIVSTPHQNEFTYATYATNSHSLCDAAVAFHTLDDVDNEQGKHFVDRVIIVPDDLNTTAHEQDLDSLGVQFLRYPRISIQNEKGHYRDSLMKFLIFKLPYKRVVYFDNDAVFLKGIKELFYLARWPIYAPRAYWLPQPFFQSTLLSITPSNQTFAALMTKFDEMGGFDMDVLNRFFTGQVAFLPSTYVVLNDEFEKLPTAKSRILQKTANELAIEAHIVHFSTSPKSGYGKPENRQPIKHIDTAHPMFNKTFNMYWDYQERLCQPFSDKQA